LEQCVECSLAEDAVCEWQGANGSFVASEGFEEAARHREITVDELELGRRDETRPHEQVLDARLDRLKLHGPEMHSTDRLRQFDEAPQVSVKVREFDSV
jgi:hypothetical protein